MNARLTARVGQEEDEEDEDEGEVRFFERRIIEEGENEAGVEGVAY